MIADESVKKWFSRENGTSTVDYDMVLKNVVKTVEMLNPVVTDLSFEVASMDGYLLHIEKKYNNQGEETSLSNPKTGGLVQAKKD